MKNTTMQMVEDYKNGASLASLDRKYHIDKRKIRKILVENGIEIRNRSEQAKITNMNRSYSVNQEYFDKIDSPTKAWILGFLAANGTVSGGRRNSIKIGLSSVDRYILEEIKEELQIEANVFDYVTSNGFPVSQLVWSSANHKIQLAKYSIVPRKTYKKMSFLQIPDEYKIPFIFGYFDGDGNLQKNGRLQFCANRTELLQEFSDYLNPILNNQTVRPVDLPSRRGFYQLTYSTLPGLELYQMFLDSGTKIFLKRKQKTFQNIIKSRDSDNYKKK